MLKLQLRHESGIPLYIQIAKQIKHQIEIGKIEGGTRLPTERELAQHLKVSRNTISAAYRNLETEGFLVSIQGSGTFVNDYEDKKASSKAGSNIGVLRKIISHALEEATEAGFSLEEFAKTAEDLINTKQNILRKVKVVFIECNKEQLYFFNDKLKANTGIMTNPILLDEFQENPGNFKEIIEQANLIVTTVFHVDEVKKIVREMGYGEKEIIDVALHPQMETIVKIARIPAGSRVALICLTNNFVQKVCNRLKKSGIDYLNIIPCIAKDFTELTTCIHKVNYIIVSPNRKSEVTALANPGTQIIEFVFTIDAGSLNTLKHVLLDLKWD